MNINPILVIYWCRMNFPRPLLFQKSNIYWAHNSMSWQMGPGLTWIVYLLLHWAHSCIYRLLSHLAGCLSKSSKLTGLMTGYLACNFGLAVQGSKRTRVKATRILEASCQNWHSVTVAMIGQSISQSRPRFQQWRNQFYQLL